MPTEITQKVLTAAMHIGSGVTHVPGFDIPKVETLLWGQTVTGTVDRQAAHFFRIEIDVDGEKVGDLEFSIFVHVRKV